MSGEASEDASITTTSIIYLCVGTLSIIACSVLVAVSLFIPSARSQATGKIVLLVALSDLLFTLKYWIGSFNWLLGYRAQMHSFHVLDDGCASQAAYGFLTATSSQLWNAAYAVEILSLLLNPLRSTKSLWLPYNLVIWPLLFGLTLFLILTKANETADPNLCMYITPRASLSTLVVTEFPVYLSTVLSVFTLIVAGVRLCIAGAPATRSKRARLFARQLIYLVAFMSIWSWDILSQFISNPAFMSIIAGSEGLLLASIRLVDLWWIGVFEDTREGGDNAGDCGGSRRRCCVRGSSVSGERRKLPTLQRGADRGIEGPPPETAAKSAEGDITRQLRDEIVVCVLSGVCQALMHSEAHRSRPPPPPVSSDGRGASTAADAAFPASAMHWVVEVEFLESFNVQSYVGDIVRQLEGDGFVGGVSETTAPVRAIGGGDGEASTISSPKDPSVDGNAAVAVANEMNEGGLTVPSTTGEQRPQEQSSPSTSSPIRIPQHGGSSVLGGRPTSRSNVGGLGSKGASFSPLGSSGPGLRRLPSLLRSQGEGLPASPSSNRLFGLSFSTPPAPASFLLKRHASSAASSSSSPLTMSRGSLGLEDEATEASTAPLLDGGASALGSSRASRNDSSSGSSSARSSSGAIGSISSSASSGLTAYLPSASDGGAARSTTLRVDADHANGLDASHPPCALPSPASSFVDTFVVTSFADSAFAALREAAGITTKDMVVSLEPSLLRLGEIVANFSGGASSSFFAFSSGPERAFVLKTLRHDEVERLISMLPSFAEHLRENPQSLLCRFYGCFSIAAPSLERIYVAIMGNVLPSAGTSGGAQQQQQQQHYVPQRLFDLKGSTLGRDKGLAGARAAADEASRQRQQQWQLVGAETGVTAIAQDAAFFTLFPRGLRVPDDALAVGSQATPRGRAIADQLARDARFIEAQGLMDYSLVILIKTARGGQGNSKRSGATFSALSVSSCRDAAQPTTSNIRDAGHATAAASMAVGRSMLSLLAQRPPLLARSGIAKAPSNRELLREDSGIALRALHGTAFAPKEIATPAIDNEHAAAAATAPPGRASSAAAAAATDGEDPEPFRIEIGIIDFLEAYTCSKSAERFAKTCLHAFRTCQLTADVSAVEPGAYCDRFVAMVHKVFS